MLGALEVKAITRFARQHAAEWKPLHTAVLGCLLAHRNRRSGRCFPERRLLAAHCNVHERTIDRVLAELTAWGAIERQQPRALSSQQFREAQYAFLFELQAEEISCESAPEKRGKSCADQPGRAPSFAGAVRQNPGQPCDKIGGAVRQNRGPNKEEGKDLEGKGQRQSKKGEASPRPKQFHSDSCQECGATDISTPGCKACEDLDRWVKEKGLDQEDRIQVIREQPRPQYTQQDFDERDWRKLNQEIERVKAETSQNRSNNTGEDNFRIACQRAGISVKNGYALWERMMA